MKVVLALAFFAMHPNPVSVPEMRHRDVVVTASCNGGNAVEVDCIARIPKGIKINDTDFHDMLRCVFSHIPIAVDMRYRQLHPSGLITDLVTRIPDADRPAVTRPSRQDVKVVMKATVPRWVETYGDYPTQIVDYILPVQSDADAATCDKYTVKMTKWVTGSPVSGIVVNVQ